MAKIRIHELAKEILEKNAEADAKTLTQDILKILQDAGSDAKNHMSTVTDEEADKIRAAFSGSGKAKKPAKAAEPHNDPEKAEAPVKTASEKPAAKPEKAPAKEGGEARQQAKTQNAQGGQGVANRRGVLRSRDGREIYYRVAQDGRLINVENNKPLPFKMNQEGIIIGQDGRPITRKPSGSQPARPAVPPMNQVFDGRSERDKQRAANNAQNKAIGPKGALTNALGDKISAFADQIDPSAPVVNNENRQKKKKTDADFPLPVLPDDFKNGKASVQEPENTAPAETPAVEPQTEPEPAPAVSAAPEAPAAEPKSLVNPIVHGNIFDNPTVIRHERPQGGQTGQTGQRTYSSDRPQQGGQRGDRRGQNNGSYREGERTYSSDRQGRPYGDRPQRQGQGQGQGERRPYGDRPQGERRPYGDKPQGERRPYGDRPQGQGGRPFGGAQGGGRGFGGGQGGFGDKDKDDAPRKFPPRKNDKSSGGAGKPDFVTDPGKGKRDQRRKNNDNFKDGKNNRADFDDDNIKKGKKDPNRKGAFQKPVAKPKVEVEDEIKTIVVPEVITIKELADKMKQNASALIKKLFLAGKMVTVNSELSFEEAEEIALDYEIICEKEVKVNIVEELLKEADEDEALLQKRPPVVCVMGHVDHGKTSLLDAIRKTNVTAREAGGITQHIGAYMVEIGGRKITFLDTPGHEAFTSMRMRGAQSTDIAILVVAADDGVMPQTVEAINHAKAAGVSIIIAINKMDKPGANIDRVKQELTEYELVAEDWGGDTVMVPVSAKTGEGIENLLEMVLLTADVLELKANPNRKARGVVIEAKLDKGRGPVATVLVQKGTLNVGETVVIGSVHGKVRAMVDDKGRKVKEATPSTPVELLGLNGVPAAGEVMMAVADEKEARTIAEAFIAQSKEQLIAESKKNTTLESLFSQIQEGEIKNLNIIIKADVMGSVEAVKQSLVKLSNDEVAVRVIHGGVGNINESDVNLAAASDAIVIGFNVKPDNTAKDIAEHENIDIKLYKVIYNAIDDIEAAMKGMLKPVYQEKVIGHAEVRQLFKSSGVGVIAGSFVLDGKITRGCSARITREGTQIFEGALASLKRFKDDVKEVAAGYECGLVFEKFTDLAELDQVEFYVMEEVPRN
jgi:translation initiation factor IF-2